MWLQGAPTIRPPASALLPAQRAILHVHAMDLHMAHTLGQLAPLRPIASARGCGILVFGVWREPAAQYVSLYKYNVIHKGEARPFEVFARSNPNFQAADLLRSAAHVCPAPAALQLTIDNIVSVSKHSILF